MGRRKLALNMLTAMAQKLVFCVVGVEQLASCEALENPFFIR
nr:MAG TPA: hypothetical protein [Caudoviricetes sp.]